MRIVIEICLGLLYVSCLLGCCLYFRNKRPFEQDEEQLNNLKTEKSTQYSKAALGNRGR
jgi:hypothetical protein